MFALTFAVKTFIILHQMKPSNIIFPQDRLYPSDNEFEIPTLRLDRQPENGLLLPFAPWGANARRKKSIATYHFYVDDYRFNNIWLHPEKIIACGCMEVVEPNFTLHLNMPIAYGLQLLYKKRWIARWLQECGIGVWVDLKVSEKYRELNLLGIPEGYNAFATRGYSDNIISLSTELEIAQRISGCDHPNMLVYGGGKQAKEFCFKHELIYSEQFMIAKREEGKL